jgi:SHS2 domain-containing protein
MMDQRFIYLDHPADAKFRAFGDTLEEAFANAGLAVASLMWDVDAIGKTDVREVATDGRDLQQLLVKFLGEIPYLLETKRFLLAAVEGLRIEEGDGLFHLKAVFRGDDRPSDGAVFGEVKAITYSQMKIEKGRRWTVQVVVDL